MTILIKYPKQTIKTNKKFFKRKEKEFTSSDWCKWAGWWDTDGHFQDLSEKPKGKSKNKKTAALKLKDKQPVELFSKTFETSLVYLEWKTTTPSGQKYTAQQYEAGLRGKKGIWFTKNVYPYLIKEDKKNYAAKFLGYRPESKDFTTWTKKEVLHYLATAIEGDGGFKVRGKQNSFIDTYLCSSDAQYLSDIQYLTTQKLGILSRFRENNTYQTKEGTKTMYRLYIYGSKNTPQKNINFFKSLLKDNVMTLDRKKQNVQAFVSYIS